MGFLSRDAPGLVILCLYSIGGAITAYRWPESQAWLGLHRMIDVVLLAIFFLWALMFLVWTHPQVAHNVMRWLPALLSSPLWVWYFILIFVAR